MKRFSIILLVLLLALGMFACGGKTDPPSGTPTDPPSGTPTEPPAGGNEEAPTVIENKVDLSLDKSTYEPEERIEVTLDFGKLNQDSAVIVIAASSAEHGSESVVHEDSAHTEYRWLSDFSELPFYLWAPEQDGAYDVRVYAGEGGEELASLSFTVAK